MEADHPIEMFSLTKEATDDLLATARLENGDIVAVKRVLQDPKFRNRELSIMRPLRHPNIVRLISFFYTCGSGAAAPNPSRDCAGEEGEEVFLNLVMEFVPETLYKSVFSTHLSNNFRLGRVYVLC